MAEQSSTAEPERGNSSQDVEHAEGTAESQHSAGSPSGGAGGVATTAPPFEPDEFAQLESEDTQAGRNIGVMLVFFFFYTVAVMAVVGLLTFQGCLGEVG